jgi:hypothetical protein
MFGSSGVLVRAHSGTGGPMPGEYAFEIDSNVGRYWLTHGEGFDVVVERGRRVGVVKDVVVNPYTHQVSGVVVRRRPTAWARRSAQVPIDELTAVLPASRRFLVTPEVPVRARSDRTERLRAAASLAMQRSRTGLRITRRHMGVGARHSRHALGIAADRTRTGAAAAADQARANWPAVRHALAVASVRTGHTLATAAAHFAGFVRWSWRTGRERLRESERYARSRAKRAR